MPGESTGVVACEDSTEGGGTGVVGREGGLGTVCLAGSSTGVGVYLNMLGSACCCVLVSGERVDVG